MVAVDPPNLGSLVQIGQFFVQWPLGLNVTEQNDGIRWLFLAKVDDVVKLPVDIATEVNAWFVFHGFSQFQISINKPELKVGFSKSCFFQPTG